MRKHIGITFLTLLCLVMTSCDLFMSKEEKGTKYSPTAECALDTEAFSKYFTHEIKPEIECLGAHLNDFIEIVKTDRPGYLSFDELVLFAKDNVKELDLDLIEPIEGIFQMNSLLYGDHPKYISRNHVNKLVKVFVEVNRLVVTKDVYAYFVDHTDKDYSAHNERKAKIFEAFVGISNVLTSEFKENSNELNFTGLLHKFKNLDESNIIENSEKFVFVKKMILGGLKNRFTANDLLKLLQQMPDLVKVVFDVSQFRYISKDQTEEEGMIQTLNSDAKTILRNLFYKPNSPDANESLFSIDELFTAIEVFYSDISKYRQYFDEIKKIKEVFLGSSSDNFTAKEVYFLFDDIIRENLNKGEFFYRVYMLNKEELDDASPISEDFNNVFLVGGAEKSYLDDFNRIVENYSYFKGARGTITLSQDIQRSPYAIFEVSVLENLVARLLKRYGTHESVDMLSGRGLTQADLNRIFEEFKKPLINEGFVFQYTNEEGKLVDRATNTAETLTLMATLFQHQSDGDAVMSVSELTEFALVILSSGSLAKNINNKMVSLCTDSSDCSLDHKGRYSTEFYRENILDILDTDYKSQRLRDVIPGVYSYLETEKKDDFLKVTENFARSCARFDDGQDVPMEEGDFLVMFIGMTAIEQTINRFDKGGVNPNDAPDGVLQPDEVMDAFPIYKSAVEEIIPVGFLKRYSKAFFQYLIKYEKVPDVQNIKSIKDFWKALKEGVHFIKFLFTKESKRKASASRYTLAKILEVLADFSPEAKENPFPCELLR